MHLSDSALVDVLFSNLEAGLCLVDPEGRVVRCNSTWLAGSELTTAPEGQLLSTLFPDKSDALRGLRRMAVETMQVQSMPLLQQRQASGEVWLRFRYLPLQCDEGVAVLMEVTNLTAPVRAEQALRDSEARFRRTLDGMLEGCQILDSQWRFAYVNEAVTRHIRRPAESLLGRTMTEAFPGIETRPFYAALRRCMEDRQPIRLENEMFYADGTSAWFDLSIQPQPDGLFVLSTDITQRKRAEEALRAVKEELTAVVDASPVPIVVVNLEGRVSLWSQAAEKLFGWSSAEVLGKPNPIVPESGQAGFKEMLRRTGAGEMVRQVEAVRQTKDGRLVSVSLTGAPLRDPAGRQRGTVGVMSDLTEQEAMREALGESERRFAAAFEAGTQAKLLVRRTDRRVVEVSQAYRALTGLTRDEVLARPLAALPLFPALDAVERAFTAREPVADVAFTFTRPDGQAGEGVASLKPIFVLGDDFVLVSMEDATARLRAARALQESEARFRQVTDAIHEVFWLIDLDENRVVYVNQAYEDVWGRPCAGLQADPRDWAAGVHPDDRERAVQSAQAWREPGQQEAPLLAEYRVLRPDGTVRWVQSRAFPVRDASGRVFRLAGAVRDVTETHELEEQLRQAQKLESVGLLAGGIAHDFNNLLTVINSGCDWLRGQVPEGEEREVLAEVRAASSRAASLTRQLLTFSRREVLAPRVVELESVVGDTEKMLRRIVGEDVLLSLSLCDAPTLVDIDPGSWGQVLMNLAVNARDAMPCGGKLRIATERVVLRPEVVQAHPHARPGPHVKLTVSDTGCGMTPEVRARVFEPFFTTKEVGHGTGLGLSVVHGIVTQSGGHLEVVSAPGQGTTFAVYLPEAAGAEDAPEPAPQPHTAHGTETVLVVEDEEAIRKMVVRTLGRLGYAVLQACDGVEALALAQAHPGPIHLLMTDVVMPRMSGGALAATLQAARGAIPVLYTSGHCDDAMARHGIQHEQVSFLPKPYALAQLGQRVREALEGHRAAG